MPRYKVLEPGFHNGILHKPEHPRNNVVVVDKPFKKTPSWLELIKDETAAAKKKRITAEKAEDKTNATKAEQDKVDVDNVTFTEPSGTTVEVL